MLWRWSASSIISFQSAPLTEARGDRQWQVDPVTDALFQSAPLTEARGDRIAAGCLHRHAHVSIRSPHRSKGRLEIAREWVEVNLFQSAPLTEARGDSF